MLEMPVKFCDLLNSPKFKCWTFCRKPWKVYLASCTKILLYFPLKGFFVFEGCLYNSKSIFLLSSFVVPVASFKN